MLRACQNVHRYTMQTPVMEHPVGEDDFKTQAAQAA